MQLGFACNWAPDRRASWSGTPWSLRQALASQVDVVDLGVRLHPVARTLLKAAYTHRHEGHWITTWKRSPIHTGGVERIIRRRAAARNCDAVLEIQDLARTDRPYFVYQDLSVDILIDEYDEAKGGVPHFPGLDARALRRARDRQLRIYDGATGVLAMSEWFAGRLVELTGLPPGKVHVVHPGATTTAGQDSPAPSESRLLDRAEDARRGKLLFIGKDFHTKAGDVVVEALRILRRDREVTLTVAGPATWPLEGPVPEGVSYLGRVPAGDVPGLYDTHDLLVMPSRLEGFGIVFVEALSRGLPCVARKAFAMPELIAPGQNGGLVAGDDPQELAEVVAATLADDGVYKTCLDQRHAVKAHFTWERAATDALTAIRSSLD